MTQEPQNPEVSGQTESDSGNAERAAAALEKLAKVGGNAFDRTQIDTLKERLAKIKQGTESTVSGAEAPAADQKKDAEPTQGRVLTGRDVDWSEYDLDFNVAHLYPQATFRETPQGPKWVAQCVDFFSTTKDFKNYEGRVNKPGTRDKTDQEAANLGQWLNDMVNGREGWKIEAVLPAMGGQCGILLARGVPVILPDPKPLKKKEEVEAPKAPELKAVEDAALAFMAEQKEVDKEPEAGDDPRGDLGLKPIEKGTPEHEAAVASLDENNAIPARETGTGVSTALALNESETLAPPQGVGEQPEAVSNPIIGGRANAAGGYSAAADLLRALSDPNFRASLPQEE